MSESEFTINVKVNGLEGVERLRKAIEGVSVANALKGVSAHAMSGAEPVGHADGIREDEGTFNVTFGGNLYALPGRYRRLFQDTIANCVAADKEAESEVEEPPRFSIGDVVSLKSGGPRMTVSRIETYPGNPDKCALIGCVWFTRVNDDAAVASAWPRIVERYADGSCEADFPADCLEP